MPDRSSLGQIVQLGIETVEGTQVAATKQLKSVDFNLGGHGDSIQFRPVGSKYTQVVSPTREWSVAPMTGQPVYDEYGYVLAGLIGTSVDTVTGTTGQQHVHTLNTAAADIIKTFSLEKGGSVRAQNAAGVMITDQTLTFGRTGVTTAGNCMGRRLLEGATMTATGVMTLPQVPLLGSQIDVFIDATRANLGTTKLLRAFSGVIPLTGRFDGVWPLNSTLTSFAAHIEKAPGTAVTITMEADSAGMAYLTNFRTGTVLYVRIKFTGPPIGAGPAVYSLQYDMPLEITTFNEFKDQNGVYAIDWPFVMVDDGISPMIVTLVNSIASL